MNNKIFIEYDNSKLKDISDKIYNLFISNNYNAELLNNNISLNEKINIIKNSNTKSLILSNKINNNDTNSLEIIYPLRSNDELPRTIYNKTYSLWFHYFDSSLFLGQNCLYNLGESYNCDRHQFPRKSMRRYAATALWVANPLFHQYDGLVFLLF